MRAKKDPAAFSLALLSPLRETLGTQRIVLQLSFPEYFFFFFSSSFLPEQNQEGYFIPFCSATMTSEGSKMAAQIQAVVTPAWADKYTEHSCRLLVEGGCAVVWGRGVAQSVSGTGLSYLRYLWA